MINILKCVKVVGCPILKHLNTFMVWNSSWQAVVNCWCGGLSFTDVVFTWRHVYPWIHSLCEVDPGFLVLCWSMCHGSFQQRLCSVLTRPFTHTHAHTHTKWSSAFIHGGLWHTNRTCESVYLYTGVNREAAPYVRTRWKHRSMRLIRRFVRNHNQYVFF